MCLPAKNGGVAQKECVMKNTIKFLGIIAMVAVIGFSMTACGGGDDGGGGSKEEQLKGTWQKDGGEEKQVEITYGAGLSGAWQIWFKHKWGDGTYSAQTAGFFKSYDGTTLKIGAYGDDDSIDISFTATVAGNKLTLSGLSTKYSLMEVDLSVYNGTYTKQPE